MRVSCRRLKWLSSVGLEIHAQIASKSKIFSDGPARTRDAPPNSAVSWFDIALPGTMPVLNLECVKAGVKTALALGASINRVSFFDRKHYFYPDLPAGYQITQKRVPLAYNGELQVPYRTQRGLLCVRVKQLHLEQDSGKIVFGEGTGSRKETLVDFNRAGIGLMEIVTAPDMTTGAEAAAFVRELQLLLRKLGTCDGMMQEGSLRVDANISVRDAECSTLGTRTEVKNINGLRFLAKAADYEISRHIHCLEAGEEVIQETRSFDAWKNVTVSTRGKSVIQDYRFLPEHDLPPLVLYDNNHAPPEMEEGCDEAVINIDTLRHQLPELPAQLRARLMDCYGLSFEQCGMLMAEEGAVEYFEEAMKCLGSDRDAKMLHGWVTSEVQSIIMEKGVTFAESPINSGQLVSLVQAVQEGSISRLAAKEVVKKMGAGDKRLAPVIIDECGLGQLSEGKELERACDRVIQEHPDQVAQYCAGKFRTLGYFIGRVMAATDGKGNPNKIKEIMKHKLDSIHDS